MYIFKENNKVIDIRVNYLNFFTKEFFLSIEKEHPKQVHTSSILIPK